MAEPVSQIPLVVIAVATAVMACAQVGVFIAVLVLVRRMNDSVARIERAAAPALGHLDEMSREVAQTLSLVRSELNRADRLTTDLLHRVDQTVGRLQMGLAAPVRKSAALIASARAVIRAFRRPHAPRQTPYDETWRGGVAGGQAARR